MPFFPQFSNLFVSPYIPVPSINPSDISNLDLWLDASDGSTLYDATSGGNLVTTNGASVKRWNDKSGNARHATEADQPPVLLVNGKNSKNVLDFSSNKWITSSFTEKLYTAQTSFVVFKYTSSAGLYARILTQSQSEVTDYLLDGNYIPAIRDASTNNFHSYANSGFVSSVTATLNSWYIARARHSGSALTFKLNATEGSSYTHTLNTGFSIIRVGATYLDDGSSDNGNLNNPVAEVIVYGKSLTDTESNGITSYLNNKWSIY